MPHISEVKKFIQFFKIKFGKPLNVIMLKVPVLYFFPISVTNNNPIWAKRKVLKTTEFVSVQTRRNR